MKNKKICYIISALTIIITTIFVMLQIYQTNGYQSSDIQFYWDIMYIFCFPVALYMSYLYSFLNKIWGFVFAFINDMICFSASIITYHITTDFKFIGDAETQGVLEFMAVLKIFVILISFLLYYIALVYLPLKMKNIKRNNTRN